MPKKILGTSLQLRGDVFCSLSMGSPECDLIAVPRTRVSMATWNLEVGGKSLV